MPPCPCRRYAGKVALVTASTAGIGLAIAHRLGAEGAAVVVCSRRAPSVDAALASLRAAGVRAVGAAAHVGRDEDVAALVKLAVEAYGRVDVLVSNAAVNPFAGGTLDTPDAAVAKIFDLNVRAALSLTRAVLPAMTAPGASIVFVSSVTAFAPAAPIAVYAASKTALVALARALSDELAPHVRVNVVAPGIVPTKFAAALVEADDGAAAIAQTKLQRLGTPGDIAAAVAYLASEDAGWVTGETLVVAGGMAASRL